MQKGWQCIKKRYRREKGLVKKGKSTKNGVKLPYTPQWDCWSELKFLEALEEDEDIVEVVEDQNFQQPLVEQQSVSPISLQLIEEERECRRESREISQEIPKQLIESKVDTMNQQKQGRQNLSLGEDYSIDETQEENVQFFKSTMSHINRIPEQYFMNYMEDAIALTRKFGQTNHSCKYSTNTKKNLGFFYFHYSLNII